MLNKIKQKYKIFKNNNKKGFTMVELIVVMGGIGILASIVAFNVTSYIQKADDARNEANVKQVHRASEMAVQIDPNMRVRDIYGLMTNETNELIREIASFANVDSSELSIVEYALANQHSEEGIYYISPDTSEDEHKIVVRYNTRRGTYWFEKQADDVAGHEIPTMPDNPDDIEGDVNFEGKDKVESGDKVHTTNSEESKVEVEVDGKSYQNAGSGKNLISSNPNDWQIGSVNGTVSSGVDYSQNSTFRSEYISIENTQYTLSVKIKGNTDIIKVETWIHGYDNDKKGVSASGWRAGEERTFSFNQDEKMIRILIRAFNSSGVRVSTDINKIGKELEIQLEKGASATAYEPPVQTPDNPVQIKSLKEFDIVSSKTIKSKSQLEGILYDTKQNGTYKTKVNLSKPLRSVGDVHDRLFKDTDNLWKIERNVGYRKLQNTTNTWSSPTQEDSRYVNFYTRNHTLKMDRVHDKNSPIMTNWLKTVPQQGYRSMTEEAIVRWSDVVPFVIVVKRDRVGGNSSSNINNYLKNNPLEILYELKNPTTEILPRSLQTKLNNIPSFEGSNHVYTVVGDNNLTPELHVTFKSRK